jgi:hypothetical protein
MSALLVLAVALWGAARAQTPRPACAQTTAPQQPTTQQLATQQGTQSGDTVLSFQGHTALWTMAIRADKIADFEPILAKLRDALPNQKTRSVVSRPRDGR